MVAPVVPALTTLQDMDLLVAFAGTVMAPVRGMSTPAVAELGMPEMFVTGTKGATVIVKSCV